MLDEIRYRCGTVKVCARDDASVSDTARVGHREAVAGPFVIARLEEAGATLLSLPACGFSLGARGFWPDMVRDSFIDLPEAGPSRAPIPSAARISRMDEALGWLGLIPTDRYVLRRILGARSLVHPLTDRHIFTWRRVGRLVGADHRAVQRWHRDGIDLVVAALLRRGFIFPP